MFFLKIKYKFKDVRNFSFTGVIFKEADFYNTNFEDTYIDIDSYLRAYLIRNN
jgi:hypothetical protein